MLLKFVLVSILPILSEAANIDSEKLDLFALADYLEISPTQWRRTPSNIRDKFLKKKKQKKILRNLDKLVSNNTIYVDDILHLEINSDWSQVHQIENDFKSLITMINNQYVYLRDDHWRTWRKVKNSEGKNQIICYKCQSKIHQNCSECSSRGVWVIEEGMPPCPYEIFSVVDSSELCASNYTQLSQTLKPCPSILKYADLTKSCNNPIVTRWRFIKDYKNSKRKMSTVICKGREFCEISTLYQIRPDYVIFRIVNTTNSEIIYSRVMRNHKKNYACINNCGVIDTKTYRVTKSKEKHTIFNLLPNKSKRDSSVKRKTNIFARKALYSTSTTRSIYNTGRRQTLDTSNVSYKEMHTGTKMEKPSETTTPQSQCKRIIEADAKRNKEENTYDDYHEDLGAGDGDNLIR